MTVFTYDHTFEGLLTCVFDAYFRRTFPDALLLTGEPLPLFCDESFDVVTDTEKSERVWRALQKKLSTYSLTCITMCWLSELSGVDQTIFRYIRKNLDAPGNIELNFVDEDVLELTNLWKKVGQERERVVQFLRFQKCSDGTFFAAMEPRYNVLPVAVQHFRSHFADQRWLIYDIRRKYGYYYDLEMVAEVSFDQQQEHLVTGILSEALLSEDEKLFQQLWQTYFKSIAIKERRNPKLHRQLMPQRFWKYLTEKKG